MYENLEREALLHFPGIQNSIKTLVILPSFIALFGLWSSQYQAPKNSDPGHPGVLTTCTETQGQKQDTKQ